MPTNNWCSVSTLKVHQCHTAFFRSRNACFLNRRKPVQKVSPSNFQPARRFLGRLVEPALVRQPRLAGHVPRACPGLRTALACNRYIIFFLHRAGRRVCRLLLSSGSLGVPPFFFCPCLNLRRLRLSQAWVRGEASDDGRLCSRVCECGTRTRLSHGT